MASNFGVCGLGMAKKSDPKEDPDFKAVVRHFLNTKPKPHKPKGKNKSQKLLAISESEKLFARQRRLCPSERKSKWRSTR